MTAALADIKATLEWYLDAGVDEAIEATPQPREVRKSLQPENKLSTPSASKPDVLLQPAKAAMQPTTNPLKAAPSQGLSEAKALADKCTTLEELKAAVESFHGLSIRKMAQNTVFADGNPESSVMLIGEAPGADEDRNGIPFCGASGQLLDQMLSCVGLLRPKNFYITNTIFWRPPGNRKPTPEEIALCKPFVEKHIALLNPKLIILIGGTAISSVLDINTGITKIRGKFFDYTNDALSSPIKTTALFHPSYLLRSPGQKKVTWKDLLTIDAFLTEYNVPR